MLCSQLATSIMLGFRIRIRVWYCIINIEPTTRCYCIEGPNMVNRTFNKTFCKNVSLDLFLCATFSLTLSLLLWTWVLYHLGYHGCRCEIELRTIIPSCLVPANCIGHDTCNYNYNYAMHLIHFGGSKSQWIKAVGRNCLLCPFVIRGKDSVALAHPPSSRTSYAGWMIPRSRIYIIFYIWIWNQFHGSESHVSFNSGDHGSGRRIIEPYE
jgi:hypothetical protein